MRSIPAWVFVAAPLLPITSLAASIQSFTLPNTTPPNASPPIDPSFQGFAFEVSSFWNYAFDLEGQTNKFSENLITEILSRTGGTPILRVGGTSGDHGVFNASIKQPSSLPATQHGPAFNEPFLEIGPTYFDAFKFMPQAEYILMVPLERRNYTNSVAWAKAALAQIKKLNALEIGNEPDYYPWFTLPDYIKAYTELREQLQDAIPRLRGKPIFQAIDKAWEPTRHAIPIGKVQALNSTGAIKQYAYHYYQSNFEWNHNVLAGKIANHSHTVHQMTSRIVPNIKYLRQNGHADVPLLMDEIGANMWQRTGHNNLATALWGVDYQLYCMAIGVTRVNWQQIVIPGFNMWQPVYSKWGPPLVRANYYSLPIVADFIGKNSPRVEEVDLKSDTLAAYTAWENGNLVRIAIVNMEVWGQGKLAASTRPTQWFEIKGLPQNIKSATTKYLSAPEGSWANNTLSYAGMQWTYESGGIGRQSGTLGASKVPVTNGKFGISVPAGSAVLVVLNNGAGMTTSTTRTMKLSVSNDAVHPASASTAVSTGGAVRRW